MLDVLALLVAGLDVLFALLLVWGLDQQGHAGRPLFSWFAGVFFLAAPATVFAVIRILDDGMSAWIAVTAIPPLTMLVLLIYDRAALWGNFPPSGPMQLLQRVAAVAVFALPGLLAWAAS